jgi:hypothetical protein
MYCPLLVSVANYIKQTNIFQVQMFSFLVVQIIYIYLHKTHVLCLSLDSQSKSNTVWLNPLVLELHF